MPTSDSYYGLDNLDRLPFLRLVIPVPVLLHREVSKVFVFSLSDNIRLQKSTQGHDTF